MKRQKIKNPFKVEYTVVEMLSMAAAGNIGGILLSSIGSQRKIKRKMERRSFPNVLDICTNASC